MTGSTALRPCRKLIVALDPAAKRLLDMLAAAGGTADIATMSPQQLRESFRRLARSVDIKNVPVGKIEDGEWPGPERALPYRSYYPQHSAALRLPALVFFHGGGGIFGDIDTHDGLCRTLSAESGCAVISIGYRQAPEHKFPAAVEDCYAAMLWVTDHAHALGLDAQRIAVGGDSAGGGLAAVVCQMAAARGGPRLALQVLFCPVMDMAAETASRAAFAEGYFLNQATIDWMLRQYCPPGIDPKDPRLSPLRATQFSRLPPAHIHTAEFDPLRDEGAAYAQRLREAGVAARYTCHAGLIHHFYAMAGAIPAARAALQVAGAAMKDALHAAAPAPMGE
ncbi:MAG TPA: alpha/beta hydrolase [Xanthobacteraceae bacterium]